MDRLPRYRTGDSGLDRTIEELIDAADVDAHGDLVFEAVV